MREVFVIGSSMTVFGKHLNRSVKDLAGEAVESVVKDAGIQREELQAAWFSNTLWGYFSNQHSIRGQVALRALGIEGIPITNVENACASGSTAFHMAWMGVSSGLYDCALALGAEKVYNKNRLKTFKAFNVGFDVEKNDEHMALWKNAFQDLPVEIPVKDDQKGTGKNRREFSEFMDVYSGWVRWHMSTYGTTQRQLATITAKNLFNSTMNPHVQNKSIMSEDEILAKRLVSWPLTVPMCAPIGDGSAAAILCSSDFLKRLESPRPVKVLSSILGSGTSRGISEEEKDIGVRLSRTAYEKAGAGPEDMDLAEVHDATAFGELHQTEVLGFCNPGEGGFFAESGATRLDGSLPINTSGGLESKGHPIGASGLGQIYELVTQLRLEAGQRQVKGCRLALAENGGGNIGFEDASMCVHILERVSRPKYII